MPEAPVDKDHDSCSGEDDVGARLHPLDVDPEVLPEAEAARV